MMVGMRLSLIVALLACFVLVTIRAEEPVEQDESAAADQASSLQLPSARFEEEADQQSQIADNDAEDRDDEDEEQEEDVENDARAQSREEQLQLEEIQRAADPLQYEEMLRDPASDLELDPAADVALPMNILLEMSKPKDVPLNFDMSGNVKDEIAPSLPANWGRNTPPDMESVAIPGAFTLTVPKIQAIKAPKKESRNQKKLMAA